MKLKLAVFLSDCINRSLSGNALKLSNPTYTGGVSKSHLNRLMPTVASTDPNAPNRSPAKVGASSINTHNRSRPSGFKPDCIQLFLFHHKDTKNSKTFILCLCVFVVKRIRVYP